MENYPSMEHNSALRPRVLLPQRISVGTDPRIHAADDLFVRIADHLTAVGFEVVATSDPDFEVGTVAALLLPGGGDVDPARYGGDPSLPVYDVNPTQDALDFGYLERALAEGVPVLGICRGAQVMNVHFGGDLIVDLAPTGTVHRNSNGRDVFSRHSVSLEPRTVTQQAHEATDVVIASAHHQAVRTLAPGLRATGHAPDGIIEAFEGDAGWVKAVQWHPEAADTPRPVARAMFRALYDEVLERENGCEKTGA